MEKDAEGKRMSTMAAAMRQIAPYTHLGWQLFSTVALFAVIGALADRMLNSSPAALIAGAIAGIVLGLYNLLRTAKKLMMTK